MSDRSGPGVHPDAGSVLAAQSLADIERAAVSILPPDVRDFVAGGSGSETTLDANRSALDRVAVVPRVLRDVSACSTASTLLGRPVALPLALAPVAYQQLVHPDGELAASRAAAAAGVPYIVSTLSCVTIEEIARGGGTFWFQLYWLRDSAAALDLVSRAESAGAAAIVLTVDVPWMGRRLRDIRNGFTLPGRVRAVNIAGDATAHHRRAGSSAVAAHTSEAFSSALTWSSVAQLRRHTRLPLVLKGILAAEDAQRAVDCGVDAIVVSNHGGRQLDGAIPSIDALAEVAPAVAGACEVLFDSGVRSGTDVLRALALGASGVLIGRPFIWGLAAGGEQGARRVLELLALEVRDALGLSGCASVAAARQLRTVRHLAFPERAAGGIDPQLVGHRVLR
jgi:4-hydroxymandelate oxidase